MRIRRIGFVLVIVVGVLAGCRGEQAPPVDEGHSETYTSEALDISYPNALSVSNQLALGTVLLEETEYAVTPEQAATLLLLWQALQGGVTAQAEADAVLRQIEETMAPEQLKAIAAIQLTHENLRTWMQEQGLSMGPGPGVSGDDQRMPPGAPPGPPGEFPGGGEMPPEMATRQAEFAELSEEERAASQAGAPPPPDLLESLIELLSQRAAEGAGRPAGISGSRATPTPYPTPTPRPTSPPAPTIIPTEAATPASTPTTMPAEAPASPSAETVPADTSTNADVSTTSGASAVELARLEDSSPGPPFTIEVSTVRIEEDGNYKILGTVRNDGSETYEGVGVIGTFYVERHCSERYVTKGPPGQPGGGTVKEVCDPNWYGPVAAYCPCPFLEPGAECPFSLEIYARDYVAYGLHPIGQPIAFFAWHEEAPVVLNGIRVSNDGIGNVRITGSAVNENDFPLKSVTVAATLIDGSGQIVSVGSTTVLGDIESGASASFDLRIKYEPYARYEVYIQAARY